MAATLTNPSTLAGSAAASAWVERFLPLIRPGGLVLDLAAGAGRHLRLLRDRGFAVRAADRDVSGLWSFAGPGCEIIEIDLERGADWKLGGGYDAIVVTNYLHRPLLPAIASALATEGVLIYETFALGNERFGRPRNPEFLLRPGELLEAFAGLTTVAFEQAEIAWPRPAVIQRIAATAGGPAKLPQAPGADCAEPDCRPTAGSAAHQADCDGTRLGDPC